MDLLDQGKAIVYGPKRHVLVDTLLPPPCSTLHVAEVLFGLTVSLSNIEKFPRPVNCVVYPDSYLIENFKSLYEIKTPEPIVAL